MKTPQIEFWEGDFGKEYTKRNPQNMEEWDLAYMRNFGMTKVDMNAEFLSGLDKNAKILEVGCNRPAIAGTTKNGFYQALWNRIAGRCSRKSKSRYKRNQHY